MLIRKNNEDLEAVVLNRKKYQEHPAYNPHLVIIKPTLFVNLGVDKANWTAVSTNEAKNYRVVEASQQERKMLKSSDYQMEGL